MFSNDQKTLTGSLVTAQITAEKQNVVSAFDCKCFFGKKTRFRNNQGTSEV
jgi:hypothetical protein